MTTITLSIDGKTVTANQNDTVLSVLKDNDIPVNQICGAQGMCATCHFFVVAGADELTPRSLQEEITFQYTKIERSGARLACQAKILGEGIIIEMPKGDFVESEEELEHEIGKKAKATLIHPMTGEVLVEAGKLILRSALEKMKDASNKFADRLNK
jgi:ferredoxin